MLSIPHLVVIFIVVLVIFGPEKIPELARNFGKVMAEFRRVTGDLRSTFEGHLRDLEREAEQRRIAPPAASPAAPSAAEAAPASGAAPPAAAVPSGGATSGTEPPPVPPSPGTVPSKPPNAAAISGPSAPLNNPADPMHDPFLMSRDFPDPDSTKPEPSKRELDPQSEQKPERVIDGDGRDS